MRWITRSRIPITRRTQKICVVTPVIPTRLGRPVMIPILKKTIAYDSISRLFLVFWMRQPRTPVMISGPADQRRVHLSRNGNSGRSSSCVCYCETAHEGRWPLVTQLSPAKYIGMCYQSTGLIQK